MYEMSQRHPVWVAENHVNPCYREPNSMPCVKQKYIRLLPTFMSDGRYIKTFKTLTGNELTSLYSNDGTVASNKNIRFRAHLYDIQYVRKLLFHSAVCPAKFALSHKKVIVFA